MDVSELDELSKARKQVDAESVDDDAEDNSASIYADLTDALSMLRKCARLFQFVTDVDLCRTVSKRELQTMARLAEQIDTFIEETENSYEDIDDIE